MKSKHKEMIPSRAGVHDPSARDSRNELRARRGKRGTHRILGFILMANEVEAYRVGEKAFEFKGTNGFMITIDMMSNDIRR